MFFNVQITLLFFQIIFVTGTSITKWFSWRSSKLLIVYYPLLVISTPIRNMRTECSFFKAIHFNLHWPSHNKHYIHAVCHATKAVSHTGKLRLCGQVTRSAAPSHGRSTPGGIVTWGEVIGCAGCITKKNLDDLMSGSAIWDRQTYGSHITCVAIVYGGDGVPPPKDRKSCTTFSSFCVRSRQKSFLLLLHFNS